PLLYLVVTSFTQLDLTNPSSRRWAELTNYRQLAADGRFWNSVWVQAQLSFWTVSLQMVIGFTMSLLLKREHGVHAAGARYLHNPYGAAARGGGTHLEDSLHAGHQHPRLISGLAWPA